MSLTSTYFVIFCVLLIPIYYIVPKKAQWMVLLAASLIFYAFGGWTNLFYVIFTSLTAYFGTVFMDRLSDKQKAYLKDNKDVLSKEQKKEYKSGIKKQRKTVMLVTVLLNLSVMIFFKVNSLLNTKGLDALEIIIPLGISYYTLQTIGYIVDVYWNNVNAEKNYFKVLLFVSFFPQMTQGPISDFKQLSGELFKEHELTYKNYSWGFQRLIWGFFKKLVIANIMYPYVEDLFKNYAQYTGITLFIGMFVVMIQLYADFSGYMDIVCGLCEVLDIKLAENFNSPFFSKSLSEFWRRWHITLGAWFKKYVFFTVGTSRFANKVSDKVKNKFGSEAGEKAISTVALLTIWFSIGVWHSVNLPFILWGLLNGLIMIFSVWMEPVYTSVKVKLHINDNSKPWHWFQMARTFTLVSALEVFSDAGTLKSGVQYLLDMIANIALIPKSFCELLPFVSEKINLVIASAGLCVMLVFDLLHGNNKFRKLFNRIPLILRVFMIAVAFCIAIAFGVTIMMNNSGGFLYANY